MYSIVEARNRFAAIVHEAEQAGEPIRVTRRGREVAVILSKEAYERLVQRRFKADYWSAYCAWREKWEDDELAELNPDAIWGSVRDRTPMEDDTLWH